MIEQGVRALGDNRWNFLLVSAQSSAGNASGMWYFAYGSNLNAKAVAEWTRHHGLRRPALKTGKPGVLDNYRLCFPLYSEFWGGGIADIVYDPGKYVAGALYELNDAELKVLDTKVGRKLDPAGKEIGIYKRIEVKIAPLGKGEPVMAITYQGVSVEKYHIPPTKHYMDLLIAGRLPARPVDDVDQLPAELQHASRSKAERPRARRRGAEPLKSVCPRISRVNTNQKSFVKIRVIRGLILLRHDLQMPRLPRGRAIFRQFRLQLQQSLDRVLAFEQFLVRSHVDHRLADEVDHFKSAALRTVSAASPGVNIVSSNRSRSSCVSHCVRLVLMNSSSASRFPRSMK